MLNPALTLHTKREKAASKCIDIFCFISFEVIWYFIIKIHKMFITKHKAQSAVYIF